MTNTISPMVFAVRPRLLLEEIRQLRPWFPLPLGAQVMTPNITVNMEVWVAGDSLGGGISQFLLAKLDVLLDAVAEAAATSRDVAGHSSLLTAVEAESSQSVVFHLATNDLDYVSVDRLHETVVITTVGHRH